MTLESEQKQWEEKTREPVTKRFPDRKPEFRTSSGIPLPPVMTPPDPDPDYMPVQDKSSNSCDRIWDELRPQKSS